MKGFSRTDYNFSGVHFWIRHKRTARQPYLTTKCSLILFCMCAVDVWTPSLSLSVSSSKLFPLNSLCWETNLVQFCWVLFKWISKSHANKNFVMSQHSACDKRNFNLITKFLSVQNLRFNFIFCPHIRVSKKKWEECVEPKTAKFTISNQIARKSMTNRIRYTYQS